MVECSDCIVLHDAKHCCRRSTSSTLVRLFLFGWLVFQFLPCMDSLQWHIMSFLSYNRVFARRQCHCRRNNCKKEVKNDSTYKQIQVCAMGSSVSTIYRQFFFRSSIKLKRCVTRKQFYNNFTVLNNLAPVILCVCLTTRHIKYSTVNRLEM